MAKVMRFDEGSSVKYGLGEYPLGDSLDIPGNGRGATSKVKVLRLVTTPVEGCELSPRGYSPNPYCTLESSPKRVVLSMSISFLQALVFRTKKSVLPADLLPNSTLCEICLWQPGYHISNR